MKKIYLLIIVAILMAVGTQVYLEYGNYHKIPVEGGILYGKAMGNDKEQVVVLIAGSGPTDMNGNTPLLAGRNDSLLLLAEGLAKEGVSTFRYDKRTAGKSLATFNPEADLEFDTFVQDCISVVAYLKEKGYKDIILAGHSKGALVGMLTAREVGASGYISLAGTGLPIDVTLERQLLTQLSEDSQEIKVLRGLRSGTIDFSLPADHMFSPRQQQFLLSWMVYDPAAIIAELKIPVLVLHGDADIQVADPDFLPLQEAAGQESCRILPGMNHVLKDIRDVPDADPLAAYTDPSYPLHREVIPTILTYLNSRS